MGSATCCWSDHLSTSGCSSLRKRSCASCSSAIPQKMTSMSPAVSTTSSVFSRLRNVCISCTQQHDTFCLKVLSHRIRHVTARYGKVSSCRRAAPHRYRVRTRLLGHRYSQHLFWILIPNQLCPSLSPYKTNTPKEVVLFMTYKMTVLWKSIPITYCLSRWSLYKRPVNCTKVRTG